MKQSETPSGLNKRHRERAAVVLMGAPGSGKTTVARALAERTPISIIEVGTLLKREVEQATPLGKSIESFTSAGKLAPLAQVMEVVSKALQNAREDLVLFDGIPRSSEQIAPFLKMLAEQNLSLRAIIILKLDLQAALDRLAGRHICKQCGTLYNIPASSSPSGVCERCGGDLIRRNDDLQEVVRERFKRFESETVPVIEFFQKEFGEQTWEQSATAPQTERINNIWNRLKMSVPKIGSSELA